MVNKVKKETKVFQASLEIQEDQEGMEHLVAPALKDPVESRVTPCNFHHKVRQVLVVPREPQESQDLWDSQDQLGMDLQVHEVPKATVENLAFRDVVVLQVRKDRKVNALTS